MGLKYTKEYTSILNELTTALENMENLYEHLEMTLEDWQPLTKQEQLEILNTLSDDIFYALGIENKYIIGNQVIKYNEESKSLDIFTNQQLQYSISLYV